MSDTTDKAEGADSLDRPTGAYWEDPVFRFLSRQRRLADDDAAECRRLDALMRDLVDGAVSHEVYWELAGEATADRHKRRLDRKQRKGRRAVSVDPAGQRPSRNIRDLKKRIFNPHVSRENMIKALEALPSGERTSVIAGLPPGLKRKLGNYLKD